MTPAELELKIDRLIQDRSTHLDLYQQHLNSLSDSIGDLTNLVSLRLVDNNLTTLPDSIGNLTNLRELRLYQNQLQTLPDSIANLQQLTWLSLSLNRFTVFSEQITELTNLVGLRLNGNQLTVLPQSITKLTNLTHLDISGNPLIDLSILNDLPNIKTVKFWGTNLPRKYWIDLRSIPSALQLISGEIVELEIKFENFKHLSNKSLIRLPNNLGEYLPPVDREKDISNSPKSLSFIDSITKKMFASTKENLDRTRSDSHLHLSKNKLTSLPLDIGKLTHLTCIELRGNQLTSLPASIGNLQQLTHLDLRSNQLSSLPASIDNLTNLTHLYLGGNLFKTLPDAIGEMKKLTHLHLNGNLLTSIPDSLEDLDKSIELYINNNNLDCLNLNVDKLTRLKRLDMSQNQIAKLPDNLGNLVDLVSLNLSDNKLTTLPESISSLHNLTSLNLLGNPLVDLSMLQNLPKLRQVYCLGMYHFPRRYWTKFSDWKAKWLLEETNAEIRRTLIQQIGYERICQELDAIQLDFWREYTLLKIDGVERWRGSRDIYESMLLLKMTCPSTGHIHVLRVPPEMTSAEAAITWINHGIHPDKFIVQT